MLSERDVSLYWDKSYSFFSALKQQNKEKYDFIFSFRKKQIESSVVYCDFVEKLLHNACFVVFALEKEPVKKRKDFFFGLGKTKFDPCVYMSQLSKICFSTRNDMFFLEFNTVKYLTKVVALARLKKIKLEVY